MERLPTLSQSELLRMTGKEQAKGCDRHWIPLIGVRILGVVWLMLVGGLGSAAAAASYPGPVAVVASKDGKRLFDTNTDTSPYNLDDSI